MWGVWQGYFVSTVIRTLLEWADRFLSKMLGDGWVDWSGWMDTKALNRYPKFDIIR